MNVAPMQGRAGYERVNK